MTIRTSSQPTVPLPIDVGAAPAGFPVNSGHPSSPASPRVSPVGPAPAISHRKGIALGGPRRLLMSMFWDVGLAVLAYYGARALGLSEYAALLTGTLASGGRLLWVAVRDRRLDPFAGVLLVLFAAGLALSFVTGDARFLLAKDSAISGVAGLALLGSCLVGKPLCYLAALRMAGPARSELAARAAADPALRRRFAQLTLVWGGGLLAEAVLRIAVVYALPIDVAVGASTLLQLTAMGGLIAWSVYQAKRGQARRLGTRRL